MSHFTYQCSGVCSSQIDFDVEDNKLHNVHFLGGCDGNLKAIGRLVEGQDIQHIKELLAGNTCGGKMTSCADQLSKACDKYLAG